MATREYQFISGIETPNQPTATDPSADTDIMNKGYADATYLSAVSFTDDITTKTAAYTVLDADGFRTISVTGGSNTFAYADADVSTGNDTITEGTHGLADGTPFYIIDTATAESGLSEGITYFVRDTLTNTFTAAANIGDAAENLTQPTFGLAHDLYSGVPMTLPTVAANEKRIITFNKNDDTTGRVVIHCEGAETFQDGSQYKTLYSKNDAITVQATDTVWVILSCVRSPNFSTKAHSPAAGAGGRATVANKIRVYASTSNVEGNGMATRDSSAYGRKFIALQPGGFSVNVQDASTGGADNMGASRNAANLTTTIDSIPLSEIVLAFNSVSVHRMQTGISVNLNLGDIIRPHDGGQPDGTGPNMFTHLNQISARLD